MKSLSYFCAKVWKPNTKTKSMVITLPRWLVVSKRIEEGKIYEFQLKDIKIRGKNNGT